MQDAQAAAGEARRVLAEGAAPPPASTPISRTRGSSRKALKMPSEFEPPPTQATTRSGSLRPAFLRSWRRASSPMTRWKSRTMRG